MAWLRINRDEIAVVTRALGRYHPDSEADRPHMRRAQMKLDAVTRDDKPSVRWTSKEENVVLAAFNDYEPVDTHEEQLIYFLSERISGRG